TLDLTLRQRQMCIRDRADTRAASPGGHPRGLPGRTPARPPGRRPGALPQTGAVAVWVGGRARNAVSR
ncbi:hypothetical protein, partial [Streptomyces rochei]|uniref:hypothetical protein n=1 Tax=Streptomyces rochei TaxID=1928 RepID=UPI0040392CA4